ncbi:MAG: hypothetical protein ACJ8G4_04310, partial [Burkholderiales bacterium]
RRRCRRAPDLSARAGRPVRQGGVIEAKSESSVGGMSTSRSSSSGFYGAGVGLRVWKIGLRAEYERYQIKDVDRVQMLSVSALFQF